MGKWSKKVYGCPFCWDIVNFYKKQKKKELDDFLCPSCNAVCQRKYRIVFDSKIEHNIGLKLKQFQYAGKIANLKHHEKFVLLKNIYFDPVVDMPVFLHETAHIAKHQRKHHIKIPHQCGSYESDFTFTQDEEKKVIEVKNMGKKEFSKKIMDEAGKTHKIKTKINYPKFIQPESQFALKCRLMKLLHQLDVEVWTPLMKYRYDDNWKLKEVIK